MKRTFYKKNNEDLFVKYLEIYKRKFKDFTLSETNYTKILNGKKTKTIFNDEGKSNGQLLNLISRVKNDSNKKNKIRIFKEPKINWFYFNSETNLHSFSGYKVDLNSAYWSIAQQKEVIKKETTEYFEKITVGLEKKTKKKYRLKALGSLATIKNITEYKDGEIEKQYTKVDEKKRNLYMNICNEVDKVMFGILRKFDLPYYYWDCFFVPDGKLNVVTNELKKKGIGFKIDADFFTIVRGSYLSYLMANKSNVSYPIKQKQCQKKI